MSLTAMYSALYALFYKDKARRAFPAALPAHELRDAEAAELRAIDPARLEAVVALHQADLAHQWYAGRVPATWLALRVALDTDDHGLVASFTGSDAFELRVNDDADGRALHAFVDALAQAGHLPDAPWLPELLRYELVLNAQWIGVDTPRIEEFAWDVPGIRESLLKRSTFPTDEEPWRYSAIFHREGAETLEAQLEHDEARVARALLAGDDVSREPPRLVKRCKALLREIPGW
ncbi:MAG: hypothetical protein KF696_08660 [Planctomycetes bacterium]|nr:hypothetical protein [Planctomycetota bacterium]MCW8136668.1 hypothetical protein [Planctomycetota bacterium]